MNRARYVFVWLAATALLSAQQRDTVGPAVSAGTAQLSGSVMEDDGRTPVRGAVVTISASASEIPRDRSVVTDETGAFAIAGLPAGRFTVTASKAAYVTASYGATRPGRAGIPVTVAAGQIVRGLSITLTRGGVITGTLRDINGVPVPDIIVAAVKKNAVPSRAVSTTPTIATDDRGVYRIFGLPPGDYIVAATFRVTGIGDISAPSTQEVDRIFADLQRASATPASAARTAPSPATELSVVGYAPTFYPGTPVASDAEFITIAKSETHTADFTVGAVRTGMIEATLATYDGSPLPTSPPIMPSLAQDGALVQQPGLGAGPTLSLRPGADGKFRFTGVTPGKYFLVAQSLPARGGPPTPPLWAVADIVSTGADITGVTLTLAPGARLSGRIEVDGAAPPPAEAAKIRIVLATTRVGAPLFNSLAPVLASSAGAMANPDATFEISGMAPGQYTL